MLDSMPIIFKRQKVKNNTVTQILKKYLCYSKSISNTIICRYYMQKEHMIPQVFFNLDCSCSAKLQFLFRLLQQLVKPLWQLVVIIHILCSETKIKFIIGQNKIVLNTQKIQCRSQFSCVCLFFPLSTIYQQCKINRLNTVFFFCTNICTNFLC